MLRFSAFQIGVEVLIKLKDCQDQIFEVGIDLNVIISRSPLAPESLCQRLNGRGANVKVKPR